MKTKIFCDIAELDQIRKFNKKTIVKGFTTNPSLMRKAGAKDYKSYSKKILQICKSKPVSLEVFADNYKEMRQPQNRQKGRQLMHDMSSFHNLNRLHTFSLEDLISQRLVNSNNINKRLKKDCLMLINYLKETLLFSD